MFVSSAVTDVGPDRLVRANLEHIFVADTNLFFECKRLEDISWEDLGVEPIVVVLTKPVIGEIDKHKRSGTRTRKRALEISGRIRDYAEVRRS